MCPYGVVTGKIGKRWRATAENPKEVCSMWGARDVLLERSERESLRGMRVLYIPIARRDGDYGIAERWRVVESAGPNGHLRRVPFTKAPWLADSINDALGGVHVTEEKALVLYDPLCFDKPIKCSKGQVPHNFLIAGLDGQQVEEADALLFMLSRGEFMVTLDNVRAEASHPCPLRSLRRLSMDYHPRGLLTKCHETAFNPDKDLTSAVLENTGDWPINFIAVEGLVYAAKGWQSIEQAVIDLCVDCLAHR
jgi:hypothetical protein